MPDSATSLCATPDAATSVARGRVMPANVLGILLPGLLGLITGRGRIGLA